MCNVLSSFRKCPNACKHCYPVSCSPFWRQLDVYRWVIPKIKTATIESLRTTTLCSSHGDYRPLSARRIPFQASICQYEAVSFYLVQSKPCTCDSACRVTIAQAAFSSMVAFLFVLSSTVPQLAYSTKLDLLFSTL